MCKFEGSEGCDLNDCPGTRFCKAYMHGCNLQYYHANEESMRARSKQYHEDNRETRLEYKKVYREKNKDIISEKYKQWYQENHEYNLERRKQYYDDYGRQQYEATYVPVGDLKIYMSPDSSLIYMRSMSEVYFACILDDEGVDWKYEHRDFETPYGKYTPDFYIIPWNAYVEVKAAHWMDMCPLQQTKREWLREQGINIYMIDSEMIDADFKE
jgi:hypothetical protein